MDKNERDRVKREIERIVGDSQFELFDLKVGQDRSIHLMVDRRMGKISVADIARFNVFVRNELLRAGIAMDDWSLDLESPGAFRPLRKPADFARFAGERARIVRRDPKAKDRVVVGVIDSTDVTGIRLKPEKGDPFTIPFTDVADARLDPQLPF